MSDILYTPRISRMDYFLIMNSAKLIQLLLDPNCIIKLTRPNQVGYKNKKMLRNIVLIVFCISLVNIKASSISVFADVDTNAAKVVLMPNKEVAHKAQQNAPGLWLSTESNSTNTSQNNIMNQTKIGSNNTISGQYIIILKDEVTRTAKGLQDTLDNLTAKVLNEGAKVIYVYKYSTKGLAIRVPSQQVLEKLLNDLKKDPRIASIEPDKSVQAF